eukprot:879436-Pleurochrysis_carterae.AAC.1
MAPRAATLSKIDSMVQAKKGRDWFAVGGASLGRASAGEHGRGWGTVVGVSRGCVCADGRASMPERGFAAVGASASMEK